MTEKLDSLQMATFVARGCLRLPGVVPEAINAEFVARARKRRIAEIPAGTPLADAYDPSDPIAELLALPAVRGAIESLVGPDARFDHHFLHVAQTRAWHDRHGLPHLSQHTHQDSTIDPRFAAFDVQLMYFPHAVGRHNGGTRYVPGTHLRCVSEAAIARYQNIRGQRFAEGPAGTLLLCHHNLWHGGGRNDAETPRYMFKIRLNPTVPQVRLWDTSDLPDTFAAEPIFWRRSDTPRHPVIAALMEPQPWFEMDTGRLELVNRIRLWRALSGQPTFDAEFWLGRLAAPA